MYKNVNGRMIDAGFWGVVNEHKKLLSDDNEIEITDYEGNILRIDRNQCQIELDDWKDKKMKMYECPKCDYEFESENSECPNCRYQECELVEDLLTDAIGYKPELLKKVVIEKWAIKPMMK